jgi:hypothetical protein
MTDCTQEFTAASQLLAAPRVRSQPDYKRGAALAADGYVLAVRDGGDDAEADAWLARRVGASEVVECPEYVEAGWRREMLGGRVMWVRK